MSPFHRLTFISDISWDHPAYVNSPVLKSATESTEPSRTNTPAAAAAASVPSAKGEGATVVAAAAASAAAAAAPGSAGPLRAVELLTGSVGVSAGEG
jgi:hypothetical protein